MKKIILNESQLKEILIQEQYEDLLICEFVNEKNLDAIKRKIKKAILAGVAITTILFAISRLNIDTNQKEELQNMVKNEIVTDTVPQRDTIHDQKVQACKEYMEWAMKNQGYDWTSTKLSPEAIVTACETNDFSIPFTLAIANLESCFGTTPRARKTNSVFSVGLHDNGKNYATYSDPNESIEPFIALIKQDYLLNGKKSLNDLLVMNNFVNMNGHRYASNVKYEANVKSIMNRITKMYPILNQ